MTNTELSSALGEIRLKVAEVDRLSRLAQDALVDLAVRETNLVEALLEAESVLERGGAATWAERHHAVERARLARAVNF